MKIIKEISLSNFEFWAGAKDNASKLTMQQLDDIENAFEDMGENCFSETQINDLFWFDFAYVCELIGLVYDEEEDEIAEDFGLVYDEEEDEIAED